MSLPEIPSLGQLSEVPDPETKKGYDWTGREAYDRVIFLDFKFFKYGTNDKAHAAAVILSLCLLLVILIVAVLGLFSQNASLFDKLVNLLGNAFLFISGVAVGHSVQSKNKDS